MAGRLDAWRLEGELQVLFGLEEKKERTMKGGLAQLLVSLPFSFSLSLLV